MEPSLKDYLDARFADLDNQLSSMRKEFDKVLERNEYMHNGIDVRLAKVEQVTANVNGKLAVFGLVIGAFITALKFLVDFVMRK